MIPPTFTNRDQYISKAKSALTYYYNQAHRYGFALPWLEFLNAVGGKHADIFLENFGWTIQTLTLDDQLTESKLRGAMEDLADRGQGKIPASQTMWFQALSDKIQNYSWIDAGLAVSAASIKDIAGGVQDVGDGVLTVFKSFKAIGPLMIVGAIIFIFYSRVKKLA
jgi:hypothetical protein